jgi:hypothetical protein
VQSGTLDRLQQGLQICVAAELIEDPTAVGCQANGRSDLGINVILGFEDQIFNVEFCVLEGILPALGQRCLRQRSTP